MSTREIFVVSAARTAIGTFGGSLKDVPNTQLATTASRPPSHAQALRQTWWAMWSWAM